PGATAESFLASLAPGAAGPPPGTPVGGTGALSPGVHSWWRVSLTPGDYLLVCFVPDPSGVPHILKGMVRAFSIAA
ncbi:MAG TPA: hypothetical protein VNH46_11145, partial [Gemmatimonadales bacterium]|nr:hypothetical protein [Gemmatimonadales bacterium]